MNTVPSLLPIVPVASATAWHAPREEREHDLRAEQIVHATVAEGGQERVLLQLGRERFWAETGSPLQTGQMLQLQVLATAPQLLLKVVGGDPLGDSLGHLLHLLGSKSKLAALAAEMTASAGPMAPDVHGDHPLGQLLGLLSRPPEALNGNLLRELVRRLVPTENSDPEEDLPALHQTLRALRRQSAATDAPRAEALSALLQQLDLQLLCQARLAQAGLTYLPLPFPFLEQGFLLIERGSPTVPEEGSVQLSLHLSLAALGDLRIDVLYDRQGLSLRFCCGSKESMALLAGLREELGAAPLGLPLRGVAFVTGAANPVQALIQRLFPDGEAILNTRV